MSKKTFLRWKMDQRKYFKGSKKYNSDLVWQIKSATSYKRSRELGMVNVISQKKRINQTKELLFKNAKNYSSRSEWNKKSNNAYKAALKKIC